MYLLEHDGKELLSQGGVHVPTGCLIASAAELAGVALPAGPLVVKGQISTGGRGKAGIIKKAANLQEAATHAAAMLGSTVKGRTVSKVRVEQDVGVAVEAYIALMFVSKQGEVRIIVAERGGVDIEELGKTPGAIVSETAALDRQSLIASLKRTVAGMPAHVAAALSDAGASLIDIFLEREALLIEINPLFVRPDATWVAGDAKIVTDDNALVRQPALQAILERHSDAYPDVALKFRHGFDYVVVDPLGEIGVIASGAGLCMMLLDELRASGLKPYNFLDVRAGAFHGSTTRLVNVLNWILEGKRVKLVLINIMAGGINLGEFCSVMFAAFAEIRFDLPYVVRFAGRNLAEAQQILEEKGIPLHTELDPAIAEVRRRLGDLR